MYRLYGIRKEEFSRRVRGVVAVSRAGGRRARHRRRRGRAPRRARVQVRLQGAAGDGAIRTIRGVGQTIRSADGRAVRMVGINRDVTDLISAEREREQLVRLGAAQAPGAPRSARGQPHDRAARRQGGGRERQPGEERLPGQHVARDPHADERDPRLRPAAAARPGRWATSRSRRSTSFTRAAIIC